jgi:hypothetical protein
MSTKLNFRVVHQPGDGTSYAFDSATAKDLQAEHGGLIECYVYGYGWVRWCEAMQEPEVVK